MLVVVLLLPLSSAMDNSEFDHNGGGSRGGHPAEAAVAVVAGWTIETGGARYILYYSMV
jgi:hypothetical protein